MNTNVTIITPCCRPQNLPKIFDSIDFNFVNNWIIVYDTSRDRTYTRSFTEHPKIIEAECDIGLSGNPQRNLGLKFVSKGYVYFLDDDNIMHPNFWKVYNSINNLENIYSFDMERQDGSIKEGNQPFLHVADTAMVLIPYHFIKGLEWYKHFVYSDGLFISTLYYKNMSRFIYIPMVLSYYNKLA